MTEAEAERHPEAGDDDPRIARAVRSFVWLSRVFEQVCRSTGVSLAQYRLLLFLRHGPKRAGELAAQVAIKRPTLTALVAGLEKDDRLRRVADENDGRGVRIELTTAGAEALAAVESQLVGVIGDLCDQGDREQLLASFDEFASIVDVEFERQLRGET